MSTRPQFSPHPVIAAGNMAGNVTSPATIVQKISMFSYSYSWTGTAPVGTIGVQVSNDYSLNADGSVGNAGTWNNLPLNVSGSIVTTVPVTGDTGNGFVDIDQMGAYAARTVYTATSGTGTLRVIISGKVS